MKGEREMNNDDRKPLKLPKSDAMPVLPEAELAEVTARFTNFMENNILRRKRINRRLAEYDKGNERQ